MPKRNVFWILAIIVVALLTLLLTRQPAEDFEPAAPARFQNAGDTLQYVHENYYRSIDSDVLLRGAIKGMVSGLDEYSRYFPPEQEPLLLGRMDGTASGLGLQISAGDRWIRIERVAHRSPAWSEGIRPGMRLVAIGDTPATAKDVEEISAKLNVPSGETVELVLSDKSAGPQTVKITAREYPVQSVTGLYLSENGRWKRWILPERRIAYLRIEEFVNDTAEKVQQAIRELGAISGLVLDLRSNPGGKGAIAIRVADLLLEEGRIVRMIRRNRRDEEVFASSAGTLPDFPLTVLINEETASAAELLAGALKVNHRAVLIGTRSRGKGCIQTLHKLPDGLGLLNLTTAEFVVDDERSIMRKDHALQWGVDPHREIERTDAQRGKAHQVWASSRIPLQRKPQSRPAKEPAKSQPAPIVEDLLAADVDLAKAVEWLKNPKRIRAVLHKARRRDEQDKTQMGRYDKENDE